MIAKKKKITKTKQKQTNMIQPRFIQFCIISVSTLINI